MPPFNLPQLVHPRLQREPVITRVLVGAAATLLLRAGLDSVLAENIATVLVVGYLAWATRRRVTPA